MIIRIKQNELIELLTKNFGVDVDEIEIKLWQYSGNKGQFARLFNIGKIDKESQIKLEKAKSE